MGFLHYDAWQEWAGELDSWLTRRLRPDVLEKLTPLAEPNWIAWLDSQHAALGGPASVVELIIGYVRTRYDGLRVFHVTRRDDLASIRAQGLRGWSADELRQRAREVYAASFADAEELDQAIERARPDLRAGLVATFRCLRDTLSPGGLEFAREGSEWLRAVRDQLKPASPSSTEVLTGRPYVLACDVPWNQLGDDCIEAVGKDASLTVLARRLDFEVGNLPVRSGVAHTVAVILPEHIVEVTDLEAHLHVTEPIRADTLAWVPFSRP